MEELKKRIETERQKLDQLIGEGKMEETYQQSLVVDGLIAQYIDLTKN